MVGEAVTTPADQPDLRCWKCGVEPLDVIDVSTLGQLPGTSLIPAGWPSADHNHEVTPPTPADLAARGDRSLARIMEIWAE